MMNLNNRKWSSCRGRLIVPTANLLARVPQHHASQCRTQPPQADESALRQ